MASHDTLASQSNDAFRLRTTPPEAPMGDSHIHHGVRCATDSVGHETPDGQPPTTIVLDASAGFIPLWEKNTTLRWRFNKKSMAQFADPTAAKQKIRNLMGEALLAWGKAAPVKFKEDNDTWDFQVVLKPADDCDVSGCVLASAFFPDAGRHELEIYPRMFGESTAEQVETLVHEFGHVFGLRHFFAKVSEGAWPSEIFGEHKPFTIMNYGNDSKLTQADRSDLADLYAAVWKGQLTAINGTPIRLMRPYHLSGRHAGPTMEVDPADLR
jgi:hypothetical protein